MNHKFEFLRNISHNWQREKEERKERRKREKVDAFLPSKNASSKFVYDSES